MQTSQLYRVIYMNDYPGGSPHQRVLKTFTAVGTKTSSVVSLWLGTSPACHPVGPQGFSRNPPPKSPDFVLTLRDGGAWIL